MYVYSGHAANKGLLELQYKSILIMYDAQSSVWAIAGIDSYPVERVLPGESEFWKLAELADHQWQVIALSRTCPILNILL